MRPRCTLVLGEPGCTRRRAAQHLLGLVQPPQLEQRQRVLVGHATRTCRPPACAPCAYSSAAALMRLRSRISSPRCANLRAGTSVTSAKSPKEISRPFFFFVLVLGVLLEHHLLVRGEQLLGEGLLLDVREPGLLEGRRRACPWPPPPPCGPLPAVAQAEDDARAGPRCPASSARSRWRRRPRRRRWRRPRPWAAARSTGASSRRG